MKPALIAAIVLAFIVCFTPRGKAQHHSGDIAANAQGNNPSVLTPFVQGEKATRDDEANDRQSPQRDSPAQWILIIITGITAGFICWQAWETRRAATAASKGVIEVQKQAVILERQNEAIEKSADATLKNAQAFIDAERPWIDVTVVENEYQAGHFFFKVTNKGRTPAFFVDGTFDSVFKLSSDKLDPIPEYKVGFFAPNERFLTTGEHFHIKRTLSGEELRIGINPTFFIQQHMKEEPAIRAYDILFFWGRIIYEDVLKKKRHETRWCFAFDRYDVRFYRAGSEGREGYNYYS